MLSNATKKCLYKCGLNYCNIIVKKYCINRYTLKWNQVTGPNVVPYMICNAVALLANWSGSYLCSAYGRPGELFVLRTSYGLSSRQCSWIATAPGYYKKELPNRYFVKSKLISGDRASHATFQEAIVWLYEKSEIILPTWCGSDRRWEVRTTAGSDSFISDQLSAATQSTLH